MKNLPKLSHKEKLKKIQILVKGLFKNASGEPYELTEKQAEMFMTIINPHIKWQWQSAPTRYGKTDILSMGLLYLAVVKNLRIPIVAGTQDKANKIMEYVVSHVADHPSLSQSLINQDMDKIDRLKVQVSKQGLRWSTGGWMYITSIDSRSLSREGEGVVGDGGDVVVLEEAGLIKREEQFSKIVRMPESNRGWGKLIMSGNCVEKSIFEKAYNNPRYYKMRITLEDSVREGRYTWEDLEAKKEQTTSKDWKRYYLVEFPDANEYAYFKPHKYDYLPLEMAYVGAVDLSLGINRIEAGFRQRSKTGIVVLGVDEKGKIYEVESIEKRMGPDEAIRTILNMPYDFNRFGVEAIQFQKYFLKVIDREARQMGKDINFIGIEQKRKKEERIESLEPHINNGHILFRGNNDLWDSLRNYPDLDWFDGLDALEMAYRLTKLVRAELGAISRPKSRQPIPVSAAHLIDTSKFR